MTHQQIKQTLTSAIPTLVCAIALALSFWVISATESRAKTHVQSEELSFQRLSLEDAAKLQVITEQPTRQSMPRSRLNAL